MRRRATRDTCHEKFGADTEILSPFASAGDPDEAAFRAELAAGLGELPSEQRAVVHLKLWEDLTFERIAAVLGISEGNASVRLNRAKTRLREWMGPVDDR